MKTEIKKIDKLKRVVKIDVSGEELLSRKKEIYLELGKNLNTPGFRPGNAPLDVLEKYHKKLLREEFLKKALPLYYQKALDEHRITPASYPRLYDVNFEESSLTFCAEFDIRPEAEACTLSGRYTFPSAMRP